MLSLCLFHLVLVFIIWPEQTNIKQEPNNSFARSWVSRFGDIVTTPSETFIEPDWLSLDRVPTNAHIDHCCYVGIGFALNLMQFSKD